MTRLRRRVGIWALVAAVAILGLLLVVMTVQSGGSALPGLRPSVADEESSPLLFVTDRKDGDSFVASDGVEYRVGLINTPELSECGGAQAADVTYEFLADGFTAAPYERDDHGRTVARIGTAAGDLGVTLAQTGYANDRYLEQHRDQNPAYAHELDQAFAAAEQDNSGLWDNCWRDEVALPAAPPPDTRADHAGRIGDWPCHPAYLECLPEGPDLDCADVGHQVTLRSQSDPYRLDGNSLIAIDGIGCDTYDPWMEGVRYAYYSTGQPGLGSEAGDITGHRVAVAGQQQPRFDVRKA